MSINFMVLKRHPYLLERLPLKCLCGEEMTLKQEFRDSRFEGVETEACKCGAPPAVLFAHRDKEDMAKTAYLMRDLLR